MNTELISAIEILQNKIEELEENYNLGIKKNVSFNTLNTFRTRIVELKKELHHLELSLLDGLRKKQFP